VMPSGRLVVTRDNATSIRSMRAMLLHLVFGALRLQPGLRMGVRSCRVLVRRDVHDLSMVFLAAVAFNIARV
jgi:hypothetical protein